MIGKTLYVCVWVLFNLGVASCQQLPELPKTPRHLRPLELKMTTEPASPIVGKLMCDSDNRLYYRVLRGGVADMTSVMRLSPADLSVTRFTIDRVPDFRPKYGERFAVTADGDVYLIAWGEAEKGERPRFSAFAFRKDGSFLRRTEFTEYIGPTNLAVFSNGSFLIAGRRDVKNAAGGTINVPFTGVFSSDGTLLKIVKLDRDKEIERAAYGDALDDKRPKPNPTGFRSIDLGTAVTAGDGNVYVLRYGAPGLIYAVSPAGEVVRSITVHSPDNASAMDLQPFRDGLIVRFGELGASKSNTYFSVLNFQGEEVAAFDASAITSPLGCYLPLSDSFVFLTSAQGKVAIINAAPE